MFSRFMTLGNLGSSRERHGGFSFCVELSFCTLCTNRGRWREDRKNHEKKSQSGKQLSFCG